MKIAFVGKGGSGKTTLSSLFIRHLADQHVPVVAIDADINQNLGAALGLDEESLAKIPPLGAHLDQIKELLRGDNPRIASARSMIKTTPPGRGSRLLTVAGDDPLHDRFGVSVHGATLMVGRDGHPFRRRERAQLIALAGIADRAWTLLDT